MRHAMSTPPRPVRRAAIALLLAAAPVLALAAPGAPQIAPMPPVVVLDAPIVRGAPSATIVGWPGGSPVELRAGVATDFASPTGSPAVPGASPVWWAPAAAAPGARVVILPVWPAGSGQVPTAPQAMGAATVTTATLAPCTLTETGGWAMKLSQPPQGIALMRVASVPVASRDERALGVYNNHPGFANAQTMTTPARTVAVVTPGTVRATPLALYRADCPGQ